MVREKAGNRKLSLLMNGVLVGWLEKKKSAELTFQYCESWLNTPGARPLSLSLPLVSSIYFGDRVYNFFDNILPDNAEIRARIQTRFRTATDQPFDLLAKIGRDCVGAIQIIEGEIPTFNKKIECETVSDSEIAKTLQNYRQSPLGMLESASDFRISLAGAQEKTAFLLHQGQWCRPHGSTPTSHIFKLPIGYIANQSIDLHDSCENEWLCTQIVKAFGLPVANCKIEYFDHVKVLVVERFDRALSNDNQWLIRLPQEDMCQALGISPHLKYQADGGPGICDIMHLLLSSKSANSDRDHFFLAQIVFWILAAIDGHAKNFSIFLEPYGGYRLTPLYDILSAYPLMANKTLSKQKTKMAMALKGKNNHYHWYNCQRRHFLQMAHAANYSMENAERLLDTTLEKLDDVIDQVSGILPKNFPETVSLPIFEGMRKMKERFRSRLT